MIVHSRLDRVVDRAVGQSGARDLTLPIPLRSGLKREDLFPLELSLALVVAIQRRLVASWT